MKHVVWDWNGTLLDDLPLVIEAVNIGLDRHGVAAITDHDYRTHYTRPVRLFYDRLFGRAVTDEEWLAIDQTFQAYYAERIHRVALTVDAVAALVAVARSGLVQSVLSMAPHDHLVPTVTGLGLGGYFVDIRGSRHDPGATKEVYLAEHLAGLDLDPGDVVVVGDVPDDVAAARHVGAAAVLYDGGSHHRHDLEAVGVPVASTLLEAVALATE